MSKTIKKNKFLKFDLSVWQVITLGYLIVISVGTFLLCLPISSKQGVWSPFINAFFTATSATCVTGLVIYDTFTHWTTFGHVVILILIQIGGVGFMTIITLFSIMLKKKIGLFERKLIMISSASDKLSGNVSLVKRIVLAPALFEGNYANDPLIILTIGSLIVIGGIGFVVWSDIVTTRFKPNKFSLHTKVVLISTFLLLSVSTLIFFFVEKNNPATLKNKTLPNKILNALFLAITPRTAGFNSVETDQLHSSSIFLTMGLMLIGGSTGSTAGGIKITTLVVILVGFLSIARNREEIDIFRKRIDPNVLKHALIILCTYLGTIAIATFILLIADNLPIEAALFKTFSAIGTVGLSITQNANLTVISKLTIILLMVIGRVGILTIALALGQKKKEAPIKFGIDKIHIG